MTMYDAIRTFSTQFGFEPEVEQASKLGNRTKFLIAGMGGSHLAADLLNVIKPDIDVVIHKDYGLPPLRDLKERLVIASSYSGNTEETLSAFMEAKKRKFTLAAIAVGGKLLNAAKKADVPYVALPDLHVQPRSALGVNLMALLALMKERAIAQAARALKETLHPGELEVIGETLARTLKGRVPVVYASSRNAPVAYNWKIKFNETGKIPAFMNVIPELNHNEMNGLDVKTSTRGLSKLFHFILLADSEDDPRVRKRMEVLASLYEARNLHVTTLPLEGINELHKIFFSLLVADWTAYHTAMLYKVDPEEVPLVEEFKKRIASR